ncbi:MAG: glycosyltransferase family 4 protein, partial [Thermoleophilia bacterium]|nr:glycosyltransferase family 4 protein [Thermoleophilia bacterium]
MRIAYVTADFGVPVFGTKGASIHVRELTRALVSLGHEVVILTPRAGGARPPGFDVPVYELRSQTERRRAYSRELRRRGCGLLESFAPDVVYERYSLFGTGGARLAQDLGVPLVLEVNAPLAAEHARYRGLDRPESALRIERTLLCRADRVIAVSSGIARWLQELGVDEERVRIVPNGVDPARFRPDGAVRKGAVVGFVGSLKPWHDVATLVRALALVPERPQLLVVGDGPDRERLRAEAERTGVDATFTGAVPYESVPAYLSGFEVAVAPYADDDRFYFSPLKLVEYLAAARPVVAAAVGDIGHCIRHGETGWLYAPGDAAGLAAAIREVLSDPVRAATVARAASCWPGTRAERKSVVEGK